MEGWKGKKKISDGRNIEKGRKEEERERCFKEGRTQKELKKEDERGD